MTNCLNNLNSSAAMLATRARMQEVFTPNQVLGRSRVIGCTAVEITQRCNLDCTLCYLSENSELVRDPPLDEVLNRLDAVRADYGAGTNVQITGGDPTLRKHNELIQIVRHAREIGLYPALFTNGIAAPRKLLAKLADAGLTEVAFHVDTTQRRNGFDSERALNEVRREYIERARDLGLMTVFNTTVHGGNIDEVPALVRFFVEQSHSVGLVSFQLQADTGRGEWSERATTVSLPKVARLIDQGGDCALPWDAIRIGHPECHCYVPTLVINNAIYPVIKDSDLFAQFLEDVADLGLDRRASKRKLFFDLASLGVRKPMWLWRGVRFLASHSWQAARDLIAGLGRVNKLSFFIHNFMGADQLDSERVNACSFMIMTAEGPISMCEHNAKRDEFILKPQKIRLRDGTTEEYIPLSAIKKTDTTRSALLP
jgi:molybdenum cofactor biosynthesis enzyme MoaA